MLDGLIDCTKKDLKRIKKKEAKLNSQNSELMGSLQSISNNTQSLMESLKVTANSNHAMMEELEVV